MRSKAPVSPRVSPSGYRACWHPCPIPDRYALRCSGAVSNSRHHA
jgi:hypothetical protein